MKNTVSLRIVFYTLLLTPLIFIPIDVVGFTSDSNKASIPLKNGLSPSEIQKENDTKTPDPSKILREKKQENKLKK